MQEQATATGGPATPAPMDRPRARSRAASAVIRLRIGPPWAGSGDVVEEDEPRGDHERGQHDQGGDHAHDADAPHPPVDGPEGVRRVAMLVVAAVAPGVGAGVWCWRRDRSSVFRWYLRRALSHESAALRTQRTPRWWRRPRARGRAPAPPGAPLDWRRAHPRPHPPRPHGPLGARAAPRPAHRHLAVRGRTPPGRSARRGASPGVAFDRVISSPLFRAQETAEILARGAPRGDRLAAQGDGLRRPGRG